MRLMFAVAAVTKLEIKEQTYEGCVSD